MAPAQPGPLFPLLGDWTDPGLDCSPSWALTGTCGTMQWAGWKLFVFIFVRVIFQWADLVGFAFCSLLSSWSLWSEEHQCHCRPRAQLCLVWDETVPTAFSQLRAHQRQQKMGKGGSCSYLLECSLRGCLFIHQIRAWCQIGPIWHWWNGPKKTAQVCVHMLVFPHFLKVRPFSVARRGGSERSCAVDSLKSCYGRGKDVHNISCQAFMCCCLYVLITT